MAKTLKDIGIICSENQTKFLGCFEYEGPINLTYSNQFNGKCSMGAFTYVNANCLFTNTTIGRFCSIATWVVTGPGQHNTSLFSTHPFTYDPEDKSAVLSYYDDYSRILGRTPLVPKAIPKRITSNAVSIGSDVWIGTRAIILEGVNVGHGAVIGAGAIVTKDVEPYAIVAGVPAVPIRKRFDDETIKKLLDLKWWEYDMSAVSNRVNYGDPDEVIAFMVEGIKNQTIQKATPRRIRIEQVPGVGYKVGEVPQSEAS